MKLLLVDDERSIRSYLRTLVDWERHGYTLLEAENGAAALELIEQHGINLLLLDITMPVMGGLEVLELLRARKSECVVTLLTCHDEFVYAKQALTLGCFDYVLKSDISAENILQVVERMKNALSEELRLRQYHEELAAAAANRSRQELQSTVNYWLQSGNAPEGSMPQYLAKTLELPVEQLRYVVLGLALRDYAKVVSRYTGSNASRFSEVLDGVLRELLAGQQFLYAQPQNGQFFVLLWFDKQLSTQTIMERMHAVAQQIDSSFHTILNIDVRLLFSLPFWGVEQSRVLYQTIGQLMEMCFFGELPAAACMQDYNMDAAPGGALLSELRSQLAQALATRNLLQIEQVVRQFGERVHSQQIYLLPADFVDTCKRAVTDWLPADAVARTDWQIWSELPTIQALLGALRTTLQPHCLTEDSNDKTNIVKKALLLIQQSYAEAISLESIAKQLWVNPSYLSHLFSEAMGQPITAYITGYRVEQAKKLITSSNLKLYEIARQTGFLSPIVFSTCFKKVTGETPTEYKNRLV